MTRGSQLWSSQQNNSPHGNSAESYSMLHLEYWEIWNIDETWRAEKQE